MRVATIAAVAAILATPVLAQGQDRTPQNAGAGDSNAMSSATADAPLANPNDEHSNTVATESGTDVARKNAHRLANGKVGRGTDDTVPAANDAGAHGQAGSRPPR